MIVRRAEQAIAKRLTPVAGEDALLEASFLLRALGFHSPYQNVSETDAEMIEPLIERRLRGEPLQYVLGEWAFYGLPFYVDRHVLIPRPDTERLVELAERFLSEERRDVLDLCCGSGCLGISVAKHCTAADCTLSDYSPQALAVARENAEQLGVRCLFLEGDLFAPMSEQRFDLILSNPPYIPSGACDTLQPEVCREPRMALDGGADGLDFYRRIAREAPAHLYSGGSVMLEVGDGEAEAVERLLLDHGARRCEAAEDFAGISRMVFADYGALPEPRDGK